MNKLFHPSDFWTKVSGMIRSAVYDAMGRRMVVHSLDGELVGLETIDGTYAGLHAYIGPWKLNVGDEVWVEPVGRLHKDSANRNQPLVVIGPLHRDAVPAAVTRMKGTRLRLLSGMDLELYSDDEATLKAAIDGSDGSASLGNVTAKSLNTPVVAVQSQTSPTPDSSTTSTSTYSVAMTMEIVLPLGTWTIHAVGLLGVRHSAAGAVRVAVAIDGSDGTSRTPDGPSSGFRTVMDDATISGVSGGRTVNVEIKFRSVDAGTTTVNNPALIAIATRTS